MKLKKMNKRGIAPVLIFAGLLFGALLIGGTTTTFGLMKAFNDVPSWAWIGLVIFIFFLLTGRRR